MRLKINLREEECDKCIEAFCLVCEEMINHGVKKSRLLEELHAAGDRYGWHGADCGPVQVVKSVRAGDVAIGSAAKLAVDAVDEAIGAVENMNADDEYEVSDQKVKLLNAKDFYC